MLRAITACAISLGALGVASGFDFQSGQSASLVLGQTDFTSNVSSNGPNHVNGPIWVTVDSITGKVFVTDRVNNRILRYPSSDALASGAVADAVFGQADFNVNGVNRGAGAANPADNSLNNPYGICIDSLGRLWVADLGNNRVLVFLHATADPPASSAARVLGQTNFTTSTLFTATSMRLNNPSSVWVDSGDHLWVADSGNNRILRFDGASGLGSGADANGVLGQTNFMTSANNVSASQMSVPNGGSTDSAGHLWVSDAFNHRILRFDDAAALADGAAAAGVLGKTNLVGGGTDSGSAGIGYCYMALPGLNGRIYVSDSNSNRVLWWDAAASKPNGAATDGVLGQADFSLVTSGLSAQKFNFPTGSFFDFAHRQLWVSDTNNNRVLRFDMTDLDSPTVTIQSKKKVHTAKSRLKLHGTAADASNALKSVEIRIGKSNFRLAQGTANWSYKAKLKFGRNKVQVRAADTSGHFSPLASMVVVRVKTAP